MSETWYQTGSTRYNSGFIEEVEVESYTNKFVGLVGQRTRTGRLTQWDCYFPTFNEAADHLMDEYVRKTNAAHGRYMLEQEKLTKFIAYLAEIAKEDQKND